MNASEEQDMWTLGGIAAADENAQIDLLAADNSDPNASITHLFIKI
jgi:hypothetical protein